MLRMFVAINHTYGIDVCVCVCVCVLHVADRRHERYTQLSA